MNVSRWDGMLSAHLSGRACGTITEGAWYHPMLSIYDVGLNAPRLWYILVNVCTATTEYYARVVLSKRILLSPWMLLTHSVSNARALRRSVPFRTAHIRHGLPANKNKKTNYVMYIVVSLLRPS